MSTKPAGRALAAQLASASYLALDVTDESSWTSGLAVVIDGTAASTP